MTKTATTSAVEQRLVVRVTELDARLVTLGDSAQAALDASRAISELGGPAADAARLKRAEIGGELGELRKERARARGVLALERLRPLFAAVLELGAAAETEIGDAGEAAIETLHWGGADLLLELARLASTGARMQWPAAEKLIERHGAE